MAITRVEFGKLMLAGTRQRIVRLGRPIKLLMISEVLTVLSLLIGHLAVMWWVSQQGGASHLAIYGMAMAATSFLSMPVLSPLCDRYPKRTMMGCGLIVLVLETLLLALMVQFGHYHLPALICLEMVAVVALALIEPAAMSIAAELVPAEQLADALSLQKSAQATGRMLGPAICGLVLAFAGVQAAIWLHVGMYAIATWAAFRIPTGSYKAPSHRRDWLYELQAGMRAKWLIPVERYWTLLQFCTNLFFIPAIGMLLPLRVQALGWSAAWLGWCEASLAAGMLFGALFASRWLTDRFGRYRAAVGALLMEGVVMVLVGSLDSQLALPLCFFLNGLCMSVVILVGQTHRMLAVPEHFRGRFSATNLMVSRMAGTAGPALVGLLLLHGSAAHVYVLSGAGLLLCALCYPWLPGYRAFLSLNHDAAKDWYGREHPEAFALPAAKQHNPVRA